MNKPQIFDLKYLPRNLEAKIKFHTKTLKYLTLKRQDFKAKNLYQKNMFAKIKHGKKLIIL